MHQLRLLWVLTLCATGLAGLGFHLYRLQVLDVTGRGKSGQHQGEIRLSPERGTLYDRNEVALALNSTRPSLRLSGSEWKSSPSAVAALASVLDMEQEPLQQRIDRILERVRNSHGTYKSDILCFNLDEKQQAAVQALALPGLFLSDGTGRVYPGGPLAASTLGFVGLGNKPRSGIEQCANAYLQGSVGCLETLRDGRGTHLLWTDVTKLQSTRGADVILALDGYIQFLAEKELEQISRDFSPQWASIIVMEPHRGEVLALANWPTYDPNHPEYSTAVGRKNFAICEAFEPGSTLKTFTLAAALNGEFIEPTDKFDCENGRYRIYGRTLRDDIHAFEQLTVEQILAYSSNIGSVKIAQQMGQPPLYEMLRRLRFGRATGIAFPGEAQGLLRPLSRWTPHSITAIPFGQEMQTTVIGLAAAYCAVANGGWFNTPRLILGCRNPRTGAFQAHDYPPSERVLSEQTAQSLTRMLTAVTEYGTGQTARVEGFRVAGKTGTGQIFDMEQRRYSREKYLASFVGFLPAEDPRVVITVVVNQPEGAKYGSQVAGPAFASLGGKLMRYLEVFPSRADFRQKHARDLFNPAPPRNPGVLAPGQRPGPTEPATLMIGMTMREAYRNLRLQGIPLAFHGSGVALQQEPHSVTTTNETTPSAFEVQFFPPQRLSGGDGQPETGI